MLNQLLISQGLRVSAPAIDYTGHLFIHVSPFLNDKDNLEEYGKCNNLNGHGHNYSLEVTLKGPVNPNTGMVENLNELKRAINVAVMDVLDHKNIDKDVPYFQNIVSTTENVAIFIWKSLKSHLKKPSLLYEVKIYETNKNVIIYRGEEISNEVY